MIDFTLSGPPETPRIIGLIQFHPVMASGPKTWEIKHQTILNFYVNAILDEISQILLKLSKYLNQISLVFSSI